MAGAVEQTAEHRALGGGGIVAIAGSGGIANRRPFTYCREIKVCGQGNVGLGGRHVTAVDAGGKSGQFRRRGDADFLRNVRIIAGNALKLLL